MGSALRTALEARGLGLRDIRHVPGIEKSHAYRQFKGEREVSAKSALAYEAALGIPRSELRPDLWPPEWQPVASPSTTPIGGDTEALKGADECLR